MDYLRPSVYERLLLAYARHFPIRRGKLRVVNALWRSVTGNRGTQRIAKLQHAGFEMPCDLSEMLQRQYYFFGTYFLEQANLACWASEAKNAKIIFDVGANAGIYSLAALAVRPDATVYAFEPTPEIASRLRETVHRNKLANLRVHEIAIHSEAGFATLHRFRPNDNEGMNFIRSGTNPSDGERIKTTTLDQFCADNSIEEIDLLKIDIQGHEHSALLGARNLLFSGRIRTIFLELNWSEGVDSGNPASQAVHLLDEAGYRFSEPRMPLIWQKPGPWLSTMTDAVARHARPGLSAKS